MTQKPPPFGLSDADKAKRTAFSRAVRPKPAATLALYYGPPDNPKILMGRRAQNHDFMPSVYVFPGGRVDRADYHIPATRPLTQRTQSILGRALTPKRAQALAMAAIRETWEETGLMLGSPGTWVTTPRHARWADFARPPSGPICPA